jgi:hypothetical protein
MIRGSVMMAATMLLMATATTLVSLSDLRNFGGAAIWFAGGLLLALAGGISVVAGLPPTYGVGETLVGVGLVMFGLGSRLGRMWVLYASLFVTGVGLACASIGLVTGSDRHQSLTGITAGAAFFLMAIFTFSALITSVFSRHRHWAARWLAWLGQRKRKDGLNGPE